MNTVNRLRLLRRAWNCLHSPLDFLLFVLDGAARIARRRGVPMPRCLVRIQPSKLTAPLIVRFGTSDMMVVQEMFVQDEYGPAICDNVINGKLIVDLGANIGISVARFASAIPQAKIIAVEPDAANISLLKKNLALQGLESRVVVVETCVSDRDGDVVLIGDDDHAWAFRIAEAGRGAGGKVVKAKSLISIFEVAGVSNESHVDLLKCDIEGAEATVFASSASWIGRVRNLIVEIHKPITADAFGAILTSAGLKQSQFERSVLKESRGCSVLYYKEKV